MAGEFTNMRALLTALAKSMNLVNPDVEHHHEQTAYLAFQIGYEMGLRDEDLHYTIYVALLHDIGSVVSAEPQTISEIEAHGKEVAKIGASMIRDLQQFRRAADLIEVVQNSYQENLPLLGESVAMDISQAVHVADAAASLVRERIPILNQVKCIVSAVNNLRGTEFSPKAVDAFLTVSKREFMWMDLSLNPSFLLYFTGEMRKVSLEETRLYTRLLSRIIDFRSPFTAMHSAGVAASARELARLCGMNAEECTMMEIAGYLHDVGKLRVPNEILEKPGKLTDEEFNIVKEHPYYTRLILKDVDGFEKITDWAGFHHEKLNGNGYPFHFEAQRLDTGARIMAVADIFSAITEVRPYRKGMDRTQAMRVLWENVESGGISREIVTLLEAHYDEVDTAREAESKAVGQRYFQSIEPMRKSLDDEQKPSP
ncbi:MAG: HD domain-containing protein [Clostridia bacterium]|nr:HD domain-containing protein [Clostridia bacterium]MBR0407400.1 HD domain-containing protein [Clostridia bacterium]